MKYIAFGLFFFIAGPVALVAAFWFFAHPWWLVGILAIIAAPFVIAFAEGLGLGRQAAIEHDDAWRAEGFEASREQVRRSTWASGTIDGAPKPFVAARKPTPDAWYDSVQAMQREAQTQKGPRPQG